MNEDVLQIYGLKGLKGVESLDSTSLNSYIEYNKERLSPYEGTSNYNIAVAKAYRNDQFKAIFGEEEFNKYSYDQREEMLKNYFTPEAIKEKYSNDPNLEGILKMTTKGQLELLNNNKYNTQESINEAFEKAKNHQMYTPTSTGAGVYQTIDKSEETKADLLNQNNEILNSIYTKDLERKKQALSPVIQETEQSILEAVQSGELSIDEIKKGFDEITQGTHYEQLKNSTTFKDFNDSDLIKEYATFLAMSKGIDQSTALQTIRADMQNYTNEHMPFMDGTGLLSAATGFSTLKLASNLPEIKAMHDAIESYRKSNPTKLSNWSRDITTQMWSDMGSTIVAIEGLTKAGESKENWLNGLDEEGNPLPYYRDPRYWQGVNQYNTSDADMVYSLQEKGGVSPYVNVTQAGDELEFWNAVNISNNLSQAIGQALPMIGTAALTMGVGNAAAAVGNTLGKISLYTLYGGLKTAEILAPSISGAHREAYEAYQNTSLALQQDTDARIDEAIKTEMERLYNSEEGKQDIQKIKNLLISQAAEQGQFYSDEEYLNELASQKYLESLQHTLGLKYEKEFNDREKEGREDASRIAYSTTFGLHAMKNVVFDMALDRVFMSKGTRQLFSDNSLFKFKPKEIIDEAGNKAFTKLTNTQKFANALSEGAQQFTGELSDAWINSLGENIGLNDFNDYVKKTYDIESYVEATDNYFNHILQGLHDLPDDMFTREALFEGWAGLVSSFAPGINPDLFTAQGRGRSFRTDYLGNEISFGEAINKYVTSPLSGAWFEYNQQERDADARIKFTKEAIEKYGPELDKIIPLISGISTTDKESSSGDMLNTVDAKFNEYVQLAFALENLGQDELFALNKRYQDADGLAQSIIEGTISEEQKTEMIDSYLNRVDNKSVSTQSPEEAWAQIQENAKKFIDVRSFIRTRKQELAKDRNTKRLSDDAKNQLILLELQHNNAQERIDKLSEELELPKNDVGARQIRHNYAAKYGNKKRFDIQKRIIAENINKNEERIKKNKEELKQEKRNLRKAVGEQEKSKVLERIQALELEQKVLEKEKIDLQVENQNFLNSESDFGEDGYARTLSKEEVLSLEPEERAAILNPNAFRTYSPEQQQIIIQTLSDLRQKDFDPHKKISDISVLQQRIRENKKAYDAVIDDPEILDLYRSKRLERLKADFIKFKNRNSANYLEEKINNLQTDQEKIEEAKKWSVGTIKAYIDTHPEMKDLLEPIIPLAQIHEDIGSVFNAMYGRAKSKRGALSTFIRPALEKSQTPEELMSNLEDLLDAPGNLSVKPELEKMLQMLEDLKYQRDATKVQSRKEKQEAKKKAEEEESKRLEEEQKRKEEELKKAKEEIEKEAPTPTVEQFEEVPKEDIVLEGEEASTPKEVIIEDSNIEIQEQPKEIIVTPSKKINTPEDAEDDNPVSLIGNRVLRYDVGPLISEGIQVYLQGKEEDDKMNKVFRWLDSLGSNYQDVIDHELTRILKANPKVQLMMTWDKDADDEIFEVVEYTDKVKKIHSEDKGGIIQSNGKRYLIISRLGYNRNNDSQYKSYLNIKDALKIERGSLRKNDPTARFMVSEKYHTEVENMREGYITRALEGEEVSLRTLEELINDPKRNPRGIPSINDLGWGIVTSEGMLLIKAGRKEVAELKNSEKNIGNVFLLVESANGVYIPVYMRPQRYNNLRDSGLKTEIDNAINELTSPNYEDRQKALELLSQRLVLNPTDNYIINNAEGNIITIKKDGVILKSFRLDDPNFSRAELIDAIKNLNARVNVNKDVLNNDYLLEQYDKAGALVTDIAKLATTDATFSVYSINSNGEPIIPRIPNPIESRLSSDFNRKQEQAILYLDTLYRKVNGEFRDEYNHTVTDPTTIEQLKLLERVKQMTPVLSKGGYDYYLLNSDPSNPSACKVHTKSNKVTMANREQSLKLINDIKEKQIREEQLKALEQVQLPEQQETTNSYDEVIKPKEKQETSEKREESVIKPISLVQELSSKESYTFKDILYDSDNGYGDSLMEILEEKRTSIWKDIPLKGNVEELSSYLESKGVSTIGIKDVNLWLKEVKECL